MGQFRSGKTYGRRPNRAAAERARRDTSTRDVVAGQGPAKAWESTSAPPSRSRFSHSSSGPINPHHLVDGVPAQAAPRREEESC